MLNWNWTLTFNIKLKPSLDLNVKLELGLTFNVKLELGLDADVELGPVSCGLIWKFFWV